MTDTRVTFVDLDGSVPVCVTLLSDLHIDSPRCAWEELLEICRARCRLPNHRLVLVGDVADLIFPPDQKRFRPSARRPELSASDDWLAESLEFVADRLRELEAPIDLISRGNHEDEVLKRFGVDPTAELARRLGTTAGGYSGFLVYRWKIGSKSVTFRIAYHHGAWGGVDNKGYSGAWRWFSRFRDWDLAVFGHNHAPRVDLEEVWEFRNGKLLPRRVGLVNLGSWVRPYDKGAHWPHYTERRGYPTRPQSATLLVLEPKRLRSGGVDMLYVDWRLEL